jgi:hypothetical protein
MRYVLTGRFAACDRCSQAVAVMPIAMKNVAVPQNLWVKLDIGWRFRGAFLEAWQGN